VTPVAEAGPWRFEVGEMTKQLRRDYLDLANRRISNG
jgi:branched-chain amino acid aminotransferase